MSFSFSFAESLECKRSLKWICDFIIAQCSRPPPAHSKDLHSSIVAAFHCCKTWLLHHPYLLQDKECISTVLEVIEFGISGKTCNMSSLKSKLWLLTIVMSIVLYFWLFTKDFREVWYIYELLFGTWFWFTNIIISL